MSKDMEHQKFISRYEEVEKEKWTKVYKDYMDKGLVVDEVVRESFIAAEVDRLITLVADTDDIGYVAEQCLKRWSVDEMINANGIIWMLEEIQQGCFRDGKRLSGRLEVD